MLMGTGVNCYYQIPSACHFFSCVISHDSHDNRFESGILSSSCKWETWYVAGPSFAAPGPTEPWSWSSLISKSTVFPWSHLAIPQATRDPRGAGSGILILISQRRQARLKVDSFLSMTQLQREDAGTGTRAYLSSGNLRCCRHHSFAIILTMLRNIQNYM